jgi:lysyl-tRNA synthetase class 2
MPSTVIRSFDYDDAKRELTVVFQSGRCYVYLDVPDTTFRAMQSAFSKGDFFNTHIREQFQFVRAGPANR